MSTVLRVPGRGAASRPDAGASERRFAHVDGLRAVAALWVVWYHALIAFQPGWDGGLTPVLTAGELGVPMFLVLSGFCLAFPVLAKGRTRVELRSFALRRALRILPPYYLVLAVVAAAQQFRFVAERTVERATDLPDLLAHLFMVHNLLPDHILRTSGPFWSIALEVQLYVVFPLLLLLMKRPWIPLAGSVALAGAWWLAGPALLGIPADAPHHTDTGNTAFAYWNALPSLLPVFVLGMVAAALLVRAWTAPPWLAAGAVGLLSAGVALRHAIDWPVPSRVVVGVATALLLLLPLGGRLRGLLSWKPLILVGEASFTLYLVHMPILRLVAAVVGSGPVATVVAVAVAVGAAIAIARVIERPLHQLARRLS